MIYGIIYFYLPLHICSFIKFKKKRQRNSNKNIFVIKKTDMNCGFFFVHVHLFFLLLYVIPYLPIFYCAHEIWNFTEYKLNICPSSKPNKTKNKISLFFWLLCFVKEKCAIEKNIYRLQFLLLSNNSIYSLSLRSFKFPFLYIFNSTSSLNIEK